jgi:hypothetical protein
VVGFLLFSLLCEAAIISLKFTVACHSVVEREEKKQEETRPSNCVGLVTLNAFYARSEKQ